MTTSLFIARLVGPVLVVISIGMLANGAQYRAIVDGFLKSPALIYLAGFLGLLGGLAILFLAIGGFLSFKGYSK